LTEKLWDELYEMYGSKAELKLGVIGEDVFNSWAKRVEFLRPEQIREGLKVLYHRKDIWPPEQQEFINICIESTPAPCHKPYTSRKLLPTMKAQKSVVEEQREKLKKMGLLGG